MLIGAVAEMRVVMRALIALSITMAVGVAMKKIVANY